MPMTTVDGMIPNYLPDAMRLTEPPKRAYKAERYELGYQTEGLAPSVDAAHKAVQWWLNDILHGCRERRRWLTLYGRSGCGKTHLLSTAGVVLRERGKRVQKWRWTRLRGMLVDGEHPGLMEQLVDMPYLLVDDIGAEYTASDRAAALSASLLYELLEARLGKWTLITSNLAPADMVDVRITSRLYRGYNELVDMRDAKDYCYQRKKGGGA